MKNILSMIAKTLFDLNCFVEKIAQGTAIRSIFVLYIEYLAIMLRQSTLYHGLQSGIELLKVALFADNTVIYLNDSTPQIECVLTILETFGSKSGCKVDFNKSCAFYLGKSKKKKN